MFPVMWWQDSTMKKYITLLTFLIGAMSFSHADEKKNDAQAFLLETQKAISDGEKLLASRPTTPMIGAHSNLMRGIIDRSRAFQQPSKFDACAAVGATAWVFWYSGMIARFNRDPAAVKDYPNMKKRYTESTKECKEQIKKG